MQRLAALVPRPRLHLIRFHGVLATNAKLRGKIIPSPAERATEPSTDHGQGAPARMSWARLLKRVFDIEHCPNDRFYSRLTRFRLGHLGEVEEARRIWSELQDINPRYSFSEHFARQPFKKKEDVQRIAEGLAKARLPTL